MNPSQYLPTIGVLPNSFSYTNKQHSLATMTFFAGADYMHRWLNRIKTTTLSKRKLLVLNIFGFLIPAFTLVLIPQMVRESLVLWLGHNMFVYVFVCICLCGIALLNIGLIIDRKVTDETLSTGLFVGLLCVMLFGSGILGISIEKQAKLIAGERYPEIKTSIIKALTAKYETDGCIVDYIDLDSNGEKDTIIVTAKYDPASNNYSDFMGWSYCQTQSKKGRLAFVEYGYDVNVVYILCFNDGEITSRAINGELWRLDKTG